MTPPEPLGRSGGQPAAATVFPAPDAGPTGWATAGDGSALAWWDLAGEALRGRGRPLLMVHGTGLNAWCWQPLATELGGRPLRPLALDLRGHGASGPSETSPFSWQLLGGDVLAVVDVLGRPSGLVGVGHSSGASALLLAEAERPGTFSGIWAWEPVVAEPGDGRLQALSREFAERSRRRREHFGDFEEARAHLAGRGMFAQFSPAALDAFLRGGLVPDEDGGFRLACAPEAEAQMFEAARPGAVWAALAQVGCPVRLAAGGESDLFTAGDLSRAAAPLPQGDWVTVGDLGHFGPFQSPAAVAEEVGKWATSPDVAAGRNGHGSP